MGSSKSKPGVYLKTQKTFYMPGQVVQGCVYINAQQPYPISKIILNINGSEKIWWKHRQGQLSNNSTYNQSLNSIKTIQKNQMNIPLSGDRFGDIKIIGTNFILNNWNNGSTKLHGQYAFPFQFQLPNFIPGSFTQQKANYKASIYYQIQSRIISTNKNIDDIITIQQLIIRQHKKNVQQSLFGQVYLYPESCCCFKNGVSRICCYFQKNQYMPGQECIAICEADNYKCKLGIKDVQVKFKKAVTLTSAFGEEKTFTQEINRASFPAVGAHSQYTGAEAKKISVPLKYKDRDDKLAIHPTVNGRLVKCRYYLVVTPQFSGFSVKNIKSFEVNLNILHTGLQNNTEVQKPQNWNPEVYRKSEIILNQNLSNELIDDMGNKNYF